METNTIVLGTEEYNRYRDFYINTRKDMVLFTIHNCHSFDYEDFLSKDDAIEKAVKTATEVLEKQVDRLSKNNEKLLKENHERMEEIKALKTTSLKESLKEVTLAEVKNMSLWQFFKWKKKQ